MAEQLTAQQGLARMTQQCRGQQGLARQALSQRLCCHNNCLCHPQPVCQALPVPLWKGQVPHLRTGLPLTPVPNSGSDLGVESETAGAWVVAACFQRRMEPRESGAYA